MTIGKNLAKHFRAVHFGGNWTSVNWKDTLADVSWEGAITKVQDFNTILTLLYHTHYYTHEIIGVLKGGPLTSKDALSFNTPTIQSKEDWDNLLAQVWADAEHFAETLEQLPKEQMHQPFTNEKYGTYFSNVSGLIEHLHYHLGQVVIIKKLLQ